MRKSIFSNFLSCFCLEEKNAASKGEENDETEGRDLPSSGMKNFSAAVINGNKLTTKFLRHLTFEFLIFSFFTSFTFSRLDQFFNFMCATQQHIVNHPTNYLLEAGEVTCVRSLHPKTWVENQFHFYQTSWFREKSDSIIQEVFFSLEWWNAPN